MNETKYKNKARGGGRNRYLVEMCRKAWHLCYYQKNSMCPMSSEIHKTFKNRRHGVVSPSF